MLRLGVTLTSAALLFALAALALSAGGRLSHPFRVAAALAAALVLGLVLLLE
jgi:hypothetical protein